MIQGVGSHQLLKVHKTVYWWLETTDCPTIDGELTVQ